MIQLSFKELTTQFKILHCLINIDALLQAITDLNTQLKSYNLKQDILYTHLPNSQKTWINMTYKHIKRHKDRKHCNNEKAREYKNIHINKINNITTHKVKPVKYRGVHTDDNLRSTYHTKQTIRKTYAITKSLYPMLAKSAKTTVKSKKIECRDDKTSDNMHSAGVVLCTQV